MTTSFQNNGFLADKSPGFVHIYSYISLGECQIAETSRGQPCWLRARLISGDAVAWYLRDTSRWRLVSSSHLSPTGLGSAWIHLICFSWSQCTIAKCSLSRGMEAWAGNEHHKWILFLMAGFLKSQNSFRGVVGKGHWGMTLFTQFSVQNNPSNLTKKAFCEMCP